MIVNASRNVCLVHRLCLLVIVGVTANDREIEKASFSVTRRRL